MADGRSTATPGSASARYRRRLVLVALAVLIGSAITAVGPVVGLSGRDEGAAPSTRVSVDTEGGDANAPSGEVAVTGRGDAVAFVSFASDLVVEDGTVHFSDIFVRDLIAGTTVRASVDHNGGDPDAPSSGPALSWSGRYVAFSSFASDLVEGEGNGRSDVFLRDLDAGTTTRVTADTEGGPTDGSSFEPAISSNGRLVAFHSSATDLVADDANQSSDVFLADTATGAITRMSVDTGGGDADGGSFDASLTAAGDLVAFQSFADDLVANDSNGVNDVFLRDRVAGITTMVSVALGGGGGNGGSYRPAISADGRYVAFWSDASDLVAGDDNGAPDVFVRDLETETTSLVSVDAGGFGADAGSYRPAISQTGRSVAFWSDADDLVPGDSNGLADLFLRDLSAGTTSRITVGARGGDADGDSRTVAISADGSVVAFSSFATNLVEGDGNGFLDVFVRDVS